MSITLLISYKDSDMEDEYTPIASVGGELQAFNGVWLPIAEKHNLPFIQTLDKGINFMEHFDDIPAIIQELHVLQEALKTWENISEERRTLISTRIETLINKLRYIQGNSSIIKRAVIL